MWLMLKEVKMRFIVLNEKFTVAGYCYGCGGQCVNVCGTQCVKDRTKN